MPVTAPPTFAGGPPYFGIAVGAAGQVLTSNGAGEAPSFQTPAAGLQVAALTENEPTTSNVLTNDTTLNFQTLTEGIWLINGLILYTTTAGISLSYSFNKNGPSNFATYTGQVSTSGAVLAYSNNFGITATAPAASGATGNEYAAYIATQALVQFTSDVDTNKVFFAWASGTNGDTVTLMAGSYLTALQVA
jgi:hypothetical protein